MRPNDLGLSHSLIQVLKNKDAPWLMFCPIFVKNPKIVHVFTAKKMFISAFCKICELNTEREIVFVFCNVYLLALDNTKR